MKQYNIYAGLEGGFGGEQYQYTTLCESIDEATNEAYQCAIDDYEQYEGLHGLPDWNDAVREYCEQNDLDESDITEEDSFDIEENYNEAREQWLEYHAVLTEEDDIDQEDLILDYVVGDDSSSQTDRERD